MTLHPQAQVLLDMMNAAPGPTPEELTPSALREQYASLAMPATVEGVDREDRTIPGPGGPLAVRIYRPVGAGTTPGIVYFHGGGWVIGDLETHDGGCAALAAASGCTLVAVDYRLAPEHPFPAPVEDCCAATVWVAEHAAEIGIDADRLAVAGDSAGGGLTLATLLALRDGGDALPATAVGISPWVDMEGTGESAVTRAEADPMISKDMLLQIAALFLGPDGDRRDPLASPLQADLAGLPPLLIQVGDAPGPAQGRRRGLYHIGIKVGDSLDELRSAKQELEQAGVTIEGMSDHTVSQSLYLRDPDGNEVEVYVDGDESVWKRDPAAVVSPIKPLYL